MKTRMTRAVAIRPLGPGDAEAYRAIRLAALATAPEAFGSTHAAEARRPLDHFAERLAGSQVFGAFDGERIVGMIGLKREDGARDAHKAFLWGVYVEPAWRGAGLAAALLEASLAAAEGVVDQVTLAVVADQTAAIRLYERFGFTRYGLEPRALKSAAGYADEVLMVRFLGPATGA